MLQDWALFSELDWHAITNIQLLTRWLRSMPPVIDDIKCICFLIVYYFRGGCSLAVRKASCRYSSYPEYSAPLVV
jgi:hypothetical protein